MDAKLRFLAVVLLAAIAVKLAEANDLMNVLRQRRQISCQAGCGPVGCCGVVCCTPQPPPPPPCCAPPQQPQLPPCCVPQSPPPPPCCVPQMPVCPPVCRPACAPACIAAGCIGGGCGRKRRDVLRAERLLTKKQKPEKSSEESTEESGPATMKTEVTGKTVDDWGYNNGPYGGFGNGYNGGYGGGNGGGGYGGGFGGDYGNGFGNGGYGNHGPQNGCRQCHSGPGFNQYQHFGYNYGYN
uniref:Uncharacterized protein n=1 Tax=Plectus sambesii TaxID=2011161 RepID=A0A914V941_9BILA